MGLLADLEQRTAQLLSLVQEISNAPLTCAILRKALNSQAQRLRSEIDSLIHAISNKKRDEEVSPHLTGILWEICKSLANTNLSNTSAVNNELNKLLPLLKDVVQELENLKSDKVMDSQLEEDEFFPEVDQEVISNCVTILKCCFMAIKKVSEHVSVLFKEEDCVGLDHLTSCCERISEGADLLGSSVYEDASEVSVNASALCQYLRDLLELVISNYNKRDKENKDVVYLEALQKKANDALQLIKRV